MWKLDADDIAAMFAEGLLVVITVEMFCWAITGSYIGK